MLTISHLSTQVSQCKSLLQLLHAYAKRLVLVATTTNDNLMTFAVITRPAALIRRHTQTIATTMSAKLGKYLQKTNTLIMSIN